MTLLETDLTTSTAWSGPPAHGEPTVRTLHAMDDGELVGAWSVGGVTDIASLVRHASDWPTWRWVGTDASSLCAPRGPVPHPGRPVAVGVPTTATTEDADEIRSFGRWANLALTGIAGDIRATADALDRLHPEIGIIDGAQLRHLPDRALSCAMLGIVAMLDDFSVATVLSAAADPPRLLAAGRDAGVKIAF